MTRWKMLLCDAVLFAGLCWLPVGMYALGRLTAMPNPLLWLTTTITVILGPLQFALYAIPTYARRPSSVSDNGCQSRAVAQKYRDGFIHGEAIQFTQPEADWIMANLRIERRTLSERAAPNEGQK